MKKNRKWLDELIKAAIELDRIEYGKLGVGNLFCYDKHVFCKREGDAISVIDQEYKIHLKDDDRVLPMPDLAKYVDTMRRNSKRYSVLFESDDGSIGDITVTALSVSQAIDLTTKKIEESYGKRVKKLWIKKTEEIGNEDRGI